MDASDTMSAKERGDVLAKSIVENTRKTIEESCDISLVKLITELKSISFSDMGDFVDTLGSSVTFKRLASIPREQRAAIKRIRVSKGGDIEYDPHDKLNALAILLKLLDAFPSSRMRLDHEVTVNVVDYSQIAVGDEGTT